MTTLSPKEQITAEFQADLLELSKSLTFYDVARILGSTVKRDRTAKIIIFASDILTYTEEEQVNVLMAAESAAGKSYLPIEIALYFPDEDVVVMGGASPTAFFHEVSGGEFATWDPDKKQSRVNLANKILIFLDQPHDQLLQKLRPFLSHDKKEIKYKISDRSQKAGLRTKTVILVGYSTVQFCTAHFNMDQQERTRVFQLSPETDPGKVSEAEDLLLEKKSDRDAFRDWLKQDPGRDLLRRRVLDIKNSQIRDIVLPQDLRVRIKEEWRRLHPHPIPRHIRDFDRLLSLVKARALLNWRSRESAGEKRVKATGEDLDDALKIYEEIREANELGLPPQVYEIFREVIQPLGTAKVSDNSGLEVGELTVLGVSRREILREYYRIYHRPMSEQRLRKEILPPLDASGLIAEEPDPNDKRQNLVYPQIPATISSARGLPLAHQTIGNSGSGVGVNETLEQPKLLHPEVPRNTPLLDKHPEPTSQLVDQNNGSLQLPFVERGPCRICNEVKPLRLSRDRVSLICQPCFDKLSEPPEAP